MLHCVAALVGGHGGSGHRCAVVYVGTEVERAVGGVVVVGERALDHLHLHVVYVVVAKHTLCHLATREAAFGTYVRILLELALHILAHYHGDDGERYEDYPHERRPRMRGGHGLQNDNIKHFVVFPI